MRTALIALALVLGTVSLTADEKDKSKEGWKDLFDGKTLTGWKQTGFTGDDTTVEDGKIVIPMTDRLLGITYTGDAVPKVNYEVELEARRVDGSDFFVGLTFPVADSHASLILGGWGGAVC